MPGLGLKNKKTFIFLQNGKSFLNDVIIWKKWTA